MADNQAQYGFRWVGNQYGMPYPKPMRGIAATGQNWNVNGDATNLNLNVGDPVFVNANGTLAIAGGSEASGGVSVATTGIVVGFGPVFNGTRKVPQTFLQSGVAWGTNRENAPDIYFIPVEMGLWEIDCNDNVTATTRAAYQLFVGENADSILTPNDAQLLVNPLLNIGSHNTTAALQYRIRDISSSILNQDFSGKNVKLIVQINKGSAPLYTATGI